jgi:hypothetical protein
VELEVPRTTIDKGESTNSSGHRRIEDIPIELGLYTFQVMGKGTEKDAFI